MNDEDDCPFYDENDTRHEVTYPCPKCGGYNTGGNYDAELFENPDDQPNWLCFDCSVGFDLEREHPCR